MQHAFARHQHLRPAVSRLLLRCTSIIRPATDSKPLSWMKEPLCTTVGCLKTGKAVEATEDPAAAAVAAAPAAAGDKPTPTGVSSTSDVTVTPGLYVVGTPIGNLEDMTYRAIRILRGVNLILAEDTRHTRKLLQYFDIKTDTLSYHQHNEQQRQELVIQRLQQGEPIALVSDAGMPAISDPGAVLVAAAVAAGVKVVPVPGPCAAIAALAASGLDTSSFHFVGFLPPKSGKRCEKLQQVANIPATLVFYVPPHALGAVLSDMVTVFQPSRQAAVARELTKLHEEFYRGPLSDLLDEFGPSGRRAGVVKGELVLLVDGCSEDKAALAAMTAAAGQTPAVEPDGDQPGLDQLLRQCLQQELLAGNSVSHASRQLSKQFKLPRSRVYKLALELQQADEAAPS